MDFKCWRMAYIALPQLSQFILHPEISTISTITCYYCRGLSLALRNTHKSTVRHCYALSITNAGTLCMGKLTGHTVGRGSLANHSARNFRWQIWLLFHWLVVICEDPRNLLWSMFLDIYTVSGPFFSFQTNFISSCKITHFMKSDNQFPFISQNNKIAEAPSNQLSMNLPFKLDLYAGIWRHNYHWNTHLDHRGTQVGLKLAFQIHTHLVRSLYWGR